MISTNIPGSSSEKHRTPGRTHIGEEEQYILEQVQEMDPLQLLDPQAMSYYGKAGLVSGL